MQFLKNLKNSIYGPDYYIELLQKPISFSFRYFFSFISLIALIASVIFLFTVAPKVKLILDKIGAQALERFPASLEITIKEGNASINQQEPYKISAPAGIKDTEFFYGKVENILVIDTKNDFTTEELGQYKTLCVLAKTIIACQREDQITIQPLSKIANLVINKAIITSWVERVRPFLNLIYPLALIGAWLVFFFSIILRLAYLLIFALVIWLIASLKKIKIGYAKSYQMGLHLMTLPIIVIILFKFLLPQMNIPFLFTIVSVLMAFINLKSVTAITIPENQSVVPGKV
jgi:hypothetical protein